MSTPSSQHNRGERNRMPLLITPVARNVSIDDSDETGNTDPFSIATDTERRVTCLPASSSSTFFTRYVALQYVLLVDPCSSPIKMARNRKGVRRLAESFGNVLQKFKRALREPELPHDGPSGDITLDGALSAREPSPANDPLPLTPEHLKFQKETWSGFTLTFGESGSCNSSDISPGHISSTCASLGQSSRHHTPAPPCPAHLPDQLPRRPRRRLFCICERVWPRHASCPGARWRESEPDGADGCVWEAVLDPTLMSEVPWHLGGQDEKGEASGWDRGRRHSTTSHAPGSSLDRPADGCLVYSI
ncbi:hypothetical protein B0H67DRAFT_281257 [Lasiosphaeris hirsuta]|uniref:Uncharacterized protein n=1 Tax=Lasiosphaeris hirsuta TaxID=260670 RepID=A0AA40A8I9_9PEZI|nr:hypothetical protein B0H67DRAFT_281257 [Lasiosphaeris hirsuta]